MSDLICLPGKDTLTKELGVRGFKIHEDTLVRRGVAYHMPRSIKRALKSGNYKGLNFKLTELRKFCISMKLNKQTKPSFIVSGNCVSFVHNGISYQTSSTNPMYNDIIEKLNDGEMDAAVTLTNIATAIDVASGGRIKNDGGVLKHNGIDLNDTVTNWLLANMGRKDGAVEAVIEFLAKCNRNPSPGSIDMLWRFVKNNGLVLFPDGDFLGYRYVNHRLYDCHTDTFDNTPGKICSMPRDQVTYNPDQHCSSGLHVGAWEHVANQANVIEVKVNPEMVVSVPIGEDWKMRVCSFMSWKLLRRNGENISNKTEHFVEL